jgi:hypothetical protein
MRRFTGSEMFGGAMDQSQFDKYVNDRYVTETAWYDRKSTRNQVWYRTLQWGLIFLSASTPAIIALAQKTASPSWLKSLSLIASVLVAILATSLKTFKFEENWIGYRSTCETLKKEIYFYRAGIDEYNNCSDREALFVKRVEALISRENTSWLATAKEKQMEKPGSQPT